MNDFSTLLQEKEKQLSVAVKDSQLLTRQYDQECDAEWRRGAEARELGWDISHLGDKAAIVNRGKKTLQQKKSSACRHSALIFLVGSGLAGVISAVMGPQFLILPVNIVIGLLTLSGIYGVSDYFLFTLKTRKEMKGINISEVENELKKKTLDYVRKTQECTLAREQSRHTLIRLKKQTDRVQGLLIEQNILFRLKNEDRQEILSPNGLGNPDPFLVPELAPCTGQVRMPSLPHRH